MQMCMDSIWLEGNQLFAVWSYLYGLMSKKMGGGRKTNLYDVEMSYAVCTRILVYSIWFLVLGQREHKVILYKPIYV